MGRLDASGTGAGHSTRSWTPIVLSGSILLSGLYLVSRENYLLFHSLVEMFSVIISNKKFFLLCPPPR